MSDSVTAVDLFAGAGGLSHGLALACESLGRDVDLVAVNHWEKALETHERNHPWADHYHSKVEEIQPRSVVDNPDDVTVITGGPECTHFSSARGGKPVDEQKRASPWHVLDWVAKLVPDAVLIENVPEFESWGPVIDGEPTRNGTFFEAWVEALRGLGYQVGWRTLNAADYGDATSRTRLFIQARRSHQPQFPDPTHSETGDGELEAWRPAAEIIDWSEPGGSIWSRDIDAPRKRPLKNSTMQRIAEGIRRHCAPRLEPLADALGELGREDVKRLRTQPVPARFAGLAADALEEPFLVATPGLESDAAQTLLRGQHSSAAFSPVGEEPVPTVTARSRGMALATPETFLLRQQSGGVPAPIGGPVPTISAGGALSRVESRPLVMPRNGPRRGLHSNPLYRPEDRPLHTVTAKNTDGYLVTPSLVRYSFSGASLSVEDPMPTIATERGGVFALSAPVVRPFLDDYKGVPQPIGAPLGTQTSRDRYALVVPECYPWGLDVRYRMLQPRELAAAQGFPPDYDFAGTKTETTEQIGNAVPVNLAQALCERLLVDTSPTLEDFGSSQTDPAAVPDGGGSV